MDASRFGELLDRRLKLIVKTLDGKRDEYAERGEVLRNFYNAAVLTRRTPAQACVGMLAKHLVSVVDLAEAAFPVRAELIDEKIGDAINYLILLEAILKERAA